MPLIVAFVYFVLEGWFLFWAAEQIGFLQVLVLLGAAALLGFYLVRSQGLSSFARANQALLQGISPHEAVLDGIVLLLCGVILIVPGLLSDILVLPLLIPGVRRAVVRRMEMRLAGQHFNSRPDFTTGKGYGQIHREDEHSAHDAWRSQSGGFGGFGARTGPFMFYRFFMSGPGPRYNPAEDNPHSYGRCSERKPSTEYKVIVHDNSRIIDVTAEQPGNDESEIRKT